MQLKQYINTFDGFTSVEVVKQYKPTVKPGQGQLSQRAIEWGKSIGGQWTLEHSRLLRERIEREEAFRK